MKVVNWIALILVVIGALNWGMVGFFKIDVVSSIVSMPVARVIFALVGLAGLWSLSFFKCVCHTCGSKKGK